MSERLCDCPYGWPQNVHEPECMYRLEAEPQPATAAVDAEPDDAIAEAMAASVKVHRPLTAVPAARYTELLAAEARAAKLERWLEEYGMCKVCAAETPEQCRHDWPTRD